ncbi:MAG TPA: alpha/beta hydrolase [Polyangia bacterium]|nr:alpha/beta hydrolase [Polyangia bacterium]
MTPLDGARLERVDVGGAELACWVAGDDGAPLVICAHGFPDCARSFRAQIPALVGAGHRVVAPYLRGYSPSTTARDERYHAAALAADLCALARHYSPGAPAALVGHDWGAIAAYAACALAPSLFSRLCTIAVPHLRAVAAHGPSRAQLARSWYIGLFQLPLIAEQRLTAENFALIDRLWRDWSPGFSAPAAELDEVKASMAGTEHVRAVLAYYRALVSWSALAGESRRLLFARTRVPSLYVHGRDDGCMGVELVEGAERAYSAGVDVRILDGAGHFAHQEKPADVNRLLVEFLALSQ